MLIAIAAIIVVVIGVVVLASNKSFYGNTDERPKSELFERAVLASDNKQPDSALAYYEQIINTYSPDLPHEDQVASAGAFNNAGYIYFFEYSDYLKAYTYFMNAHEIAQKENLTSTLSGSLLNIGNIFGEFHINDEAEKMYKEAFFLALENENWNTVLTSFLNLTYIHFNHIEFSSMADVLDAFDKAAIPDTVPGLSVGRRQHQAVMDIIAGEPEQAIKVLNECIDNDTDNKESRRINIVNRIYIARLYRNLGQTERSKEMFNSALACAIADGETDFEAECWDGLANNYLALGMQDSMIVCRLRRYEISDSMANIKKFSSIKDFAKIHEQKAMINELRVVSEKKRMREYLLTIVIVFSIVVVVLSVGIRRKNRELERRNLDLFDKYRQLSALQDAQNAARSTQSVAAPAHPTPDSATGNEPDTPQNLHAKSSLDLDHDYIRSLYDRVVEIMRTDAIFDPSFSVDTLAKLTDSKTRYISHAIATMTGKNFSTLLAEYRIKEASRRIADTATFGNLTLEAISESVGFKSRTYFATTFKKVTGLSPREYQKIAAEHPEKLV